jgi:hypothetical protein
MYGKGTEYWGRIIGVAVTFGILSAVAGLVWGLAVGFNVGTGALWGALIGGAIVFVLSLGLTKNATSGMTMMFGGFWVIAVAVGLIVWLIRTLTA